jgi:uncharacterized peroxidase-related enzyme
MSYLNLPADEPEQGPISLIYEAERARLGYVPNYSRVFGLRPEAYSAWAQLNTTVKSGMDLRRYELATLAAARRLRSSYCSLAHGTLLLLKFYDAAAVEKIASDHHNADLEPADVAVMDFAEKVVDDATSITHADIETLRLHGLSESDIFHVVLAVAARCFFSTIVDAVGAEPDHHYRNLEPGLLQLLTVGRPIESEPAGQQDQGSQE